MSSTPIVEQSGTGLPTLLPRGTTHRDFDGMLEQQGRKTSWPSSARVLLRTSTSHRPTSRSGIPGTPRVIIAIY